MNVDLKTSELWLEEYEGSFKLSNLNAWPLQPDEFDFHFYEERITRSEFLNRAMKCAPVWKISRL